jgi:hypothetical protein
MACCHSRTTTLPGPPHIDQAGRWTQPIYYGGAPPESNRRPYPYHSCRRAPVVGPAQVMRPGVTVAGHEGPGLLYGEWHGDGTAGEDDLGSGLVVMAPAAAMGEARPERHLPRCQTPGWRPARGPSDRVLSLLFDGRLDVVVHAGGRQAPGRRRAPRVPPRGCGGGRGLRSCTGSRRTSRSASRTARGLHSREPQAPAATLRPISCIRPMRLTPPRLSSCSTASRPNLGANLPSAPREAMWQSTRTLLVRLNRFPDGLSQPSSPAPMPPAPNEVRPAGRMTVTRRSDQSPQARSSTARGTTPG